MLCLLHNPDVPVTSSQSRERYASTRIMYSCGHSARMLIRTRAEASRVYHGISSLPTKQTPVLVLLLLITTVLPQASAYNTTFVQQDTNGECWQYVTHKGGKIFSHAGHGRYADNTDCKVTVIAEPGRRIHAVFESFDVTESVNCYQDEVIVYDGQQFTSLMLSGAPYGLCGVDLEPRYRELETSGNVLTVRFITDNVLSANKGFSVVYTSFVPDETRTANDKCFECRDGAMCIDSGLICDSLWNCADGSDESFELCSVVSTESTAVTNGWLGWMGTLMAITVAAIILLFVTVSLIVCCCCKRKGSGMPVGRGQGNASGAHGAGIAPSAPSSSSNSSSDGSNNTSPCYGDINARNSHQCGGHGQHQQHRPVYLQDRTADGHVFYGCPPPNGRDMNPVFGVQGGYYPMRRDNQTHEMERGYADNKYGDRSGHSLMGILTR